MPRRAGFLYLHASGGFENLSLDLAGASFDAATLSADELLARLSQRMLQDPALQAWARDAGVDDALGLARNYVALQAGIKG